MISGLLPSGDTSSATYPLSLSRAQEPAFTHMRYCPAACRAEPQGGDIADVLAAYQRAVDSSVAAAFEEREAAAASATGSDVGEAVLGSAGTSLANAMRARETLQTADRAENGGR